MVPHSGRTGRADASTGTESPDCRAQTSGLQDDNFYRASVSDVSFSCWNHFPELERRPSDGTSCPVLCQADCLATRLCDIGCTGHANGVLAGKIRHHRTLCFGRKAGGSFIDNSGPSGGAYCLVETPAHRRPRRKTVLIPPRTANQWSLDGPSPCRARDDPQGQDGEFSPLGRSGHLRTAACRRECRVNDGHTSIQHRTPSLDHSDMSGFDGLALLVTLSRTARTLFSVPPPCRMAGHD